MSNSGKDKSSKPKSEELSKIARFKCKCHTYYKRTYANTAKYVKKINFNLYKDIALIVTSVWAIFLTCKQSTISENSMKIANRAYIAAIRPTNGNDGWSLSQSFVKIDVSIKIRNVGRTPAYRINGFAKLLLSNNPLNPTNYNILDSTKITQPMTIKLNYLPKPVPDRLAWAIEQDSLYVYIVGSIEYRDVFNERHSTEFCFRHNYYRNTFEEYGDCNNAD